MSFIVEDGKLGKRMTLVGPWDPEFCRVARRLEIAELELNYAKGWKGGDLEFLPDLTFLRSLELTDWNIAGVQPIHSLRSLLRLQVSTYCKTEIDFRCFPELQDLTLEWRPKAQSVFGCTTLERIFLNKYTGSSLKPLLALPRLKHLAVASPRITEIGPSAGSILEFLGIYGAKRLESLKDVEKLTKLNALEVNDCRALSNIEPLRRLGGLASIHLCDDGEIESLDPLGEHTELRELLFYGDTCIRDGRISVVRPLSLRKVVFQDRRHYDLRRSEFPK